VYGAYRTVHSVHPLRSCSSGCVRESLHSLYIVFENSGMERHNNTRRDYVHPRDRTARTEHKTRCPTKQLPRGEIALDNNSAKKAGEGANRGRPGGRQTAPARAARPTILVRQDGSPVRSSRSRPLINSSLSLLSTLWLEIILNASQAKGSSPEVVWKGSSNVLYQ
jgi:hypothetical protein